MRLWSACAPFWGRRDDNPPTAPRITEFDVNLVAVAYADIYWVDGYDAGRGPVNQYYVELVVGWIAMGVRVRL